MAKRPEWGGGRRGRGKKKCHSNLTIAINVKRTAQCRANG